MVTRIKEIYTTKARCSARALNLASSSLSADYIHGETFTLSCLNRDFGLVFDLVIDRTYREGEISGVENLTGRVFFFFFFFFGRPMSALVYFCFGLTLFFSFLVYLQSRVVAVTCL